MSFKNNKISLIVVNSKISFDFFFLKIYEISISISFHYNRHRYNRNIFCNRQKIQNRSNKIPYKTFFIENTINACAPV